MNFSSDFSELFGFFLSRKVRFVIVAGHAVAVMPSLRNKIASDRPQDRIDVEWLKKAAPGD